MSSEKILIVEDTEDVSAAVGETFVDAGYRIKVAATGEEAMKAFYDTRPDLVLLDVLLPGLSGFELCERIRSMSNVPVIMFTALGNEREKIMAFEKGADDYVVKGTGMGELIARVGALLRRASTAQPEKQDIERYIDAVIEIDFARRAVQVRGEEIDLTPTEYKILELLVKQRGQPVPAEQLLHGVWGREYDTEELVKWHVGHLRKKIEKDASDPDLIVTRRGFGYVYAAPDVNSEAA